MDQRTKEERARDPKPATKESFIFRGEIFTEDGQGGFTLNGKAVRKLPKDWPAERVQMLKDRNAGVDDDETLTARMESGDTSVKPGASGSGVALEDVDDAERSSSVDEHGAPAFTGPQGEPRNVEQRALGRRRHDGADTPLQATGSTGKRESRSPSQRRARAAKEAAAGTPRSRSGGRSRKR